MSINCNIQKKTTFLCSGSQFTDKCCFDDKINLLTDHKDVFDEKLLTLNLASLEKINFKRS